MNYANQCLKEIELREIFTPLVTIRFFETQLPTITLKQAQWNPDVRQLGV